MYISAMVQWSNCCLFRGNESATCVVSLVTTYVLLWAPPSLRSCLCASESYSGLVGCRVLVLGGFHHFFFSTVNRVVVRYLGPAFLIKRDNSILLKSIAELQNLFENLFRHGTSTHYGPNNALPLTLQYNPDDQR